MGRQESYRLEGDIPHMLKRCVSVSENDVSLESITSALASDEMLKANTNSVCGPPFDQMTCI